MSTPTPTPWHVDNIRWGAEDYCPVRARGGRLVAGVTAQEDAALIVRAVNAHEALVDACKAALRLSGTVGAAMEADLRGHNGSASRHWKAAEEMEAKVLAALKLAQVKP